MENGSYWRKGVVVCKSHGGCVCFLQVISEQLQEGGAVSLHVAPRFQLPENRQKLTHFISQYVYN